MALIIADRVKETTTTTGTGDLTLAGAMTGMIPFASAPGMAVGSTCFYTIQAVDAGGALTGDWEVGLGTYSAANTLTRTSVISSSNAGAAVSFAAGTKQVFITVPAQQVAWARERLTAARTYYVRTDGSDSNTGLADTAGGAFLTIQKAVDVCRNTLDANGYAIVIQVADGTYTSPVVLAAVLGASDCTLQGNATTPSNVLISTTSANAVTTTGPGAPWLVKDLKVQTTTSGSGIQAASFSELHYSNIVFGACAEIQVAGNNGAFLRCDGNCSIVGGAVAHFSVDLGAIIRCATKTITITGAPAFAVFAYASLDGILYINGNTYSGSATGKKYDASLTSIIVSGVTLPGNVAGTTATGGQYV